MSDRNNGKLEEQEVNPEEISTAGQDNKDDAQKVQPCDNTVESAEEQRGDTAGESNAGEGEPRCDSTEVEPEEAGNTEEQQQTSEIDELNKLKEELAREKARADEYFNRLLRVQADFDNYRKRTQKEKAEFWKYASEPLVSALLPVLDNFQRALETPPGDVDKLLEGVKMIYRQLKEILENEGLKAISAKGEEFDPTLHEAVMQEKTDQYPDNTVMEELRTGYFYKDKLIRPAMVKVARSS